MFGWRIFSESLPGTWWLGAVLLVVGNVVIGVRAERMAKIPAGGPTYEIVGTEEPEVDREGEGHDLASIHDSDSE